METHKTFAIPNLEFVATLETLTGYEAVDVIDRRPTHLMLLPDRQDGSVVAYGEDGAAFGVIRFSKWFHDLAADLGATLLESGQSDQACGYGPIMFLNDSTPIRYEGRLRRLCMLLVIDGTEALPTAKQRLQADRIMAEALGLAPLPALPDVISQLRPVKGSAAIALIDRKPTHIMLLRPGIIVLYQAAGEVIGAIEVPRPTSLADLAEALRLPLQETPKISHCVPVAIPLKDALASHSRYVWNLLKLKDLLS